jgi:hypothetical protein
MGLDRKVGFGTGNLQLLNKISNLQIQFKNQGIMASKSLNCLCKLLIPDSVILSKMAHV